MRKSVDLFFHELEYQLACFVSGQDYQHSRGQADILKLFLDNRTLLFLADIALCRTSDAASMEMSLIICT